MDQLRSRPTATNSWFDSVPVLLGGLNAQSSSPRQAALNCLDHQVSAHNLRRNKQT